MIFTDQPPTLIACTGCELLLTDEASGLYASETYSIRCTIFAAESLAHIAPFEICSVCAADFTRTARSKAYQLVHPFRESRGSLKSVAQLHNTIMERRSGSPRVIIYHAAQCDPKKCTGLRLGRMKRAAIVRDLRRIPRGGVVLNPVSEIAFSPADRVYVQRFGLVALDCSWKQAEAVFSKFRGHNQRSLPYLIAANPINTYKPIKLSTVEAIAAALYILGDIDAAEDKLSVFKWGPSFMTLNREWLDSYALCTNSSEIVEVQTEIMKEHQKLIE